MSHGPMTRKPRLKPSQPAFSKLAHNYQKEAIKFLLTHGAAALLLDPGMGKTAIVLKALDALKRAKTNRRTLVVAPLRVAQLVWPNEPNEWSDLKGLRVGVLHGPGKERVLEDRDNYDILVINPEGLQWLLTGDRNGRNADMREFKKYGFDTLVIDELTKFKSTSGVRFKVLKQVLPTFIRRWGLTGTPAPNGLMDLFGQMYVLDLGNALGKFITHYRSKYFVPLDRNGWNWGLQPGAAERIYEAIKPLAMRASAEDHLELPELVPVKHMVELPPKVRALYESVEQDLIAAIHGKEVIASNAAAASTKCRQICNGAVYVDDDLASRVAGKKRDVLNLHDLKLDALEETFDELNGSPMLVAYEFNHDLSRLRERFKDGVFMADYKTERAAKEVEDAWNNNEISKLFGHPASMGHGLNMQKGGANHIGLFSSLWDLELFLQFIQRVRRQGNKAARVYLHHYLVADSVDMVAFFAQRRKDKNQNNLLLALAETRASKSSLDILRESVKEAGRG